MRLEEILKDEVLREKKMVVRQFETDEYRTIFKEVNKLNIKNLIVDVPRENIHEVLRHAQQVDMLSEYHDYIFTSLDLQTVDLEDFQYAGTNISSFCLIDRSSTDFKEIIREWQSSVPVTRTNWLEEDPFISRVSINTSKQSITMLITDCLFYFYQPRHFNSGLTTAELYGKYIAMSIIID